MAVKLDQSAAGPPRKKAASAKARPTKKTTAASRRPIRSVRRPPNQKPGRPAPPAKLMRALVCAGDHPCRLIGQNAAKAKPATSEPRPRKKTASPASIRPREGG